MGGILIFVDQLFVTANKSKKTGVGVLVNFASETISAGGTGNLTVSGAVDSAHVTLNNAIGLDHYFNYVIKDGNNREEGIGHLSASTTVVRDLALETIVSGTLDNTSHRL